VKLKVSDSRPGDTRDSRHQFDVEERQSAALYVSRLSQLIATLVSSATSSLDADRLLQDFSSTFCTGTTSITAVPVLLITVVLVLLLVLHKSAWNSGGQWGGF